MGVCEWPNKIQFSFSAFLLSGSKPVGLKIFSTRMEPGKKWKSFPWVSFCNPEKISISVEINVPVAWSPFLCRSHCIFWDGLPHPSTPGSFLLWPRDTPPASAFAWPSSAKARKMQPRSGLLQAWSVWPFMRFSCPFFLGFQVLFT